MSRSGWGARWLALAALACAAGCSADYVCEVRNLTGGTVEARLVQDQAMADPALLASARLGRGESATLGPARAAVTDQVRLEVSQPGEIGVPPTRKRLDWGRSTVEVTSDSGVLSLRSGG